MSTVKKKNSQQDI